MQTKPWETQVRQHLQCNVIKRAMAKDNYGDIFGVHMQPSTVPTCKKKMSQYDKRDSKSYYNVNKVQRWVVGNDDFHNTVSVMTTTRQLNRKRSITAKHAEDTHISKCSMQSKKKNKTKTHLTAPCISHLGPIYFTTLKKTVATHHTAWDMIMVWMVSDNSRYERKSNVCLCKLK